MATFKDIPYALPPVGRRRWMPPVPAPAWRGLRPASSFGPACIQRRSDPGSFYPNAPASQSEDCLSLNVWAPWPAADAPVIVWIHGGNLIQGSGAQYDGTALATRGVVLVTINYRMDIFGYFSHRELTAESANHSSGNYGTLDQIEALRWVRRNIAAFGGNPANVTIMGESAGALSVTHLMASPLATGLFQRAIAESAYLPPIPELREGRFGLPAAEQAGAALAAAANAPTLHALRTLDPQSLLEASERTHFVTQSVVDGWVQPREILETFEQGREQHVPLIIGFNRDEARSFVGYPGVVPPIPPDAATYEKLIRCRYGDLSDSYLTVYPAAHPKDSVFAAIRDAFYGWAAEKLAREHSKRAPTWLYRFDHVTAPAAVKELGAYHASELQFVFGDVGGHAPSWLNFLGSPQRPSDVKMSAVIMDYWVTFARNGRPDPGGQPTWVPFDAETEAQMAFHDGAAVSSAHLEAGMFGLHEEVVARRRRAGDMPWFINNVGLGAPEPETGINCAKPATSGKTSSDHSVFGVMMLAKTKAMDRPSLASALGGDN